MQNPIIKTEIKKLDYIDAVRGIAVLMVLMVHTLTFLSSSNLNNYFRQNVSFFNWPVKASEKCSRKYDIAV